jgi:hypothetical protein
MEQNRRQAIAAAFSAAAASLLPSGHAEDSHALTLQEFIGRVSQLPEYAPRIDAILTPETHGSCCVFDANGIGIGSLCVWANVTTGETRHLVKGDDGMMKGSWLDDGTRFEPDLETRWHPAPLRWEPMSSGATP